MTISGCCALRLPLIALRANLGPHAIYRGRRGSRRRCVSTAMLPPVGKSGGPQFRSVLRACVVLVDHLHDGVEIPQVCAAQLHAMPTAMPVEPFTSRLGNLPGRTIGSWSRSS